jgi:hypothetical protein
VGGDWLSALSGRYRRCGGSNSLGGAVDGKRLRRGGGTVHQGVPEVGRQRRCGALKAEWRRDGGARAAVGSTARRPQCWVRMPAAGMLPQLNR